MRALVGQIKDLMLSTCTVQPWRWLYQLWLAFVLPRVRSELDLVFFLLKCSLQRSRKLKCEMSACRCTRCDCHLQPGVV